MSTESLAVVVLLAVASIAIFAKAQDLANMPFSPDKHFSPFASTEEPWERVIKNSTQDHIQPWTY